jgi:demethylmenaquinone methyltransferase/2-methoxy-6-polyprenyl-1,4-benzoquinol methylase
MQDEVDFGFRRVAPEEKAPLVRGVFDSVADRYDLMNDLMSGGLHRLWKNSMIRWLNPHSGMKILDIAGGTGDIALRLLARADCQVTVADINFSMLEQGRDRAIDHNRLADIEWICANAESIPYPDNSFDAYTIAFGIRNVTYIDKALAEAFRVLKPGGRFLCLEFSHVAQPLLHKLYDTYSFHVIPQIGKMVTGSAESYRYLVESIRKFPDQEKFATMLRKAGFGNVQYRNMTQGVVALHSGRKL